MTTYCPEPDTAVEPGIALALEVRDSDGRTDLEIRLGKTLLVVEAKRGWALPSQAQLRRYAKRITTGPGLGALITLSQASPTLASFTLPTEIDGVPVRHLPWRDVLADISSIRHGCRGQERLWLDEFRAYLIRGGLTADTPGGRPTLIG